MILIARIGALCAMTLLGLVQGCATDGAPSTRVIEASTLVFPDGDRYGQRPPIPQPADFLALTVDQQSAFLRYFNDPYYAHIPAHQRVFSYLEGFTSGFNYQGDTLSASEAFAINGGNCLSLALMTTALADLAGVRIGYQLLDDVPVYEVQGTVVEKGFHVRSLLYDPKMLGTTSHGFMQAGLKVDYFVSGQERFVANLARESFIAMYYRNIAASAITVNDYSKAYWYLRESLLYTKDDSQAINMLAVVSRRTGDLARAESLYRYGLEHSEEKLTLLKNYRLLLLSQQRLAEAELLQQQLDQMPDPSPFHWFQLAKEAFDAGEYRDAIRYYRRALDLAPYMHEAYVGVAQAQHEIGNNSEAVASLQKALDNVFRPGTRKLYKAKLHAITRDDI